MEREATQLLRVAEDHDRAGRETEAVSSSELAGAFHGLGSFYRALGRYDDALRMRHDAMHRFPTDASFGPFRAMTLDHLGRPKEALALLLENLVATTECEDIRQYARAIRLYASDLDRRST